MFKYHSNRHVGVLLPIGCLNIRKFRYIGWMLGASKPIFGYWMCSNKFEQVSTDGDYGLAIDYQMSSLSGAQRVFHIFLDACHWDSYVARCSKSILIRSKYKGCSQIGFRGINGDDSLWFTMALDYSDWRNLIYQTTD